jgi:hypothetical protein
MVIWWAILHSALFGILHVFNHYRWKMNIMAWTLQSIVVEVGFSSGLLMVWSALYFVRSWRATACFRLVDTFFDTPCVYMVVKVIDQRI